MTDERAVDRVNRLALAALGLMLAALGLYTLVRGMGILGRGDAADSVSETVLGLFPDPGRPWLPAVVGSSALLIAIAAIAWAGAQFILPPQAPTLSVERTERGTTRVRGSAVGHAAAAQLARIPGTGDAKVRVYAIPSGQSADVRLEIVDGANVPGIIESAEEALSEATALAGLGPVRSSIRLVPVADKRVQ